MSYIKGFCVAQANSHLDLPSWCVERDQEKGLGFKVLEPVQSHTSGSGKKRTYVTRQKVSTATCSLRLTLQEFTDGYK